MTEERRGCDGLVPATRRLALARAKQLGDGWAAKHCRGCGSWHVFRKGRSA